MSPAKAIAVGTAVGFVTSNGAESLHALYGDAFPGAPLSGMPAGTEWLHSGKLTAAAGGATTLAAVGLMMRGVRSPAGHSGTAGSLGMGLMAGSMLAMFAGMALGSGTDRSAGEHQH